ncbi:MAG: hypothetical protein ACHQ4H_18655, partial [Ktedonobacterales bacterium]
MATEPITVNLDAEAVCILKAAAPDERRKLEALLSLQLLEATKSGLSLAELMRLISQRAQERGLTEDRLPELFADDDVHA